MAITRPYNAEDNDINREQLKVLEHYTKKNAEEIEQFEIYDEAVCVYTKSGRELIMNKAQGCRLGNSYRQNHFFYMNERINGKWKRIKKEEW